jgi:ribosome biogenesis GTPase
MPIDPLQRPPRRPGGAGFALALGHHTGNDGRRHMKGKPKKSPRQKDLTSRYMDGDLDEDRIDPIQRFSAKNKNMQGNKTLRTALMRAEEHASGIDIDALPVGEVVQVFSLYCHVEHQGRTWLCVVRKTLSKVSGWDIIVGDRVRFRDLGASDESGQPEAVIEQILPRKTVLTRADSFKQITSHPIVANAGQMLVVAAVREPNIKWGLIDRMIIAAQSGGLAPILCLNKIDLLGRGTDADDPRPLDALAHYASIGVRTLQTSIISGEGIDALRRVLHDQTTVLGGHSGVGKSSLIGAIQPDIQVRIGAISGYTGKGRHTTTSARRYALSIGGHVVDTPGVKLFGLWGVTRENLAGFFPDVEQETAPSWRRESYERIAASLRET